MIILKLISLITLSINRSIAYHSSWTKEDKGSIEQEEWHSKSLRVEMGGRNRVERTFCDDNDGHLPRDDLKGKKWGAEQASWPVDGDK